MSKEKVNGLICVEDNGKVVFTHTMVDMPMAWGDWSKAYGEKKLDGFEFPVIFVPKAHVKWRKAMPLSCLFQATKGLLSNVFGTTLDYDDARFFDEHPLATPSGVSLANTARLVQEIIEPYNLRVSRIQLAPGTGLPGDLANWVDILGMNPIALGDHATTNEMFAQLTGQDLAKVNMTYKMEYTEAPLRPCILCAVAPMSASSKTGENLGHAEYVGARAKRQGYEPTLQIQVDRAPYVHWYKSPVFPEVVGGALDIDIWQSYGPDGKTTISQYFHSQGTHVGFHMGSNRGSSQGDTFVRSIAGPSHFDCYVCYEKKPVDQRVGANLCMGCWNSLWKRYNCAGCATVLYKAQLVGLTNLKRNAEEGKGAWLVRIRCPKCQELNELRVEPGTLAYYVIKAITGVKVIRGA